MVRQCTQRELRNDSGSTPRSPYALVALSLIALAVGAVDASSNPTWRRLVTPHFVVVGEVSERDLREVGRRLEEFVVVVGRMLPRARITPPAPTTVVVFGSRASLRPFAPEVDGVPREDVAGYFLGGRDRYAIGLLHGGGDAGYRTIFHELTHLIVNNTTPDVPVWFNEGLAEFYSTFELHPSGRQGTIGRPVREHVELLRRRTMPLEALLEVTRASPEYNERDRASVFYAKSWALVHYLLNGRPERAPELFRFLDAVRGGAPTEPAFRASFGAGFETIEREVADYVRQRRFVFQSFQLDDIVIGDRHPVDLLSPAAADAVLGDLLTRLGRPEPARERLERALAAEPLLAEAHAGLGVLAWREGDREEAVEHLSRAVAFGPDHGHAHLLLGLVLAGDPDAWRDRATRETAGRVLTRAVEIGPHWPDAWFVLAQVQASSGETDEARESIERAIGLAPGRLEYRLVQADVLTVDGEIGAARAVLERLAADPGRSDVAEEARRRLAALSGR